VSFRFMGDQNMGQYSIQIYIIYIYIYNKNLKMWNMYKVTSCLVHHRLHRDHFLSLSR
ncbi:hypothetical protein ACJX0J_035263, partial [Zea mays]